MALAPSIYLLPAVFVGSLRLVSNRVLRTLTSALFD
jgi:hypothetical protein